MYCHHCGIAHDLIGREFDGKAFCRFCAYKSVPYFYVIKTEAIAQAVKEVLEIKEKNGNQKQ